MDVSRDPPPASREEYMLLGGCNGLVPLPSAELDGYLRGLLCMARLGFGVAAVVALVLVLNAG